MDRIKKILHKGKEIIVIDYSDGREEEIMALVRNAKDTILSENKNVLVYSIFNSKNFVTPKVLRLLEKETREVEPFIQKNAITGLSQTQLWILKGINLWLKKKVYPFDTEEDALDYLTDDR